jgi:hypothetical protein
LTIQANPKFTKTCLLALVTLSSKFLPTQSRQLFQKEFSMNTLSAIVAVSLAILPAQAEWLWPSEPPAGCPAAKSEAATGIVFTGRHAEYTGADTWYPSWGADGRLYSPFTDGSVNVVRSFSGGKDAVVGHADNRLGCVTITYNAPLKKYLMCVTDGGTTESKYNTGIFEADQMTGPWKLVSWMQDFGEQAYFINIPSKFISDDGRTLWLCYSANFCNHMWGRQAYRADPPGSGYAMCLQELRLLKPGEAPPQETPLTSRANLAREARVAASSTHKDSAVAGLNDGVVLIVIHISHSVGGVFGPNGTFHRSPAHGAGWLASAWASVL